jgi:hypothetical protein
VSECVRGYVSRYVSVRAWMQTEYLFGHVCVGGCAHVCVCVCVGG